jgi:outer membrane lipoprotein LolB
MTAGFLLRGDIKRGELDLYSPLGTTLGVLEWTPESVELVQGNSHQIFDSLDELTQKTTGAELPLQAIFGWLKGEDIKAAGWQADLSNASNGSIIAWRTKPLPIVNMRIKLD